MKAVFFDIDGTLLSFKTHTMPPSTLTALERARANGVKLFLATGRHRIEIEASGILSSFTFDGVVSLNGQYCYDDSGVLFKRTIPAQDIAGLVELLERDPLPCAFTEEGELYMNCITPRVLQMLELVHLPQLPVVDISRALSRDIYQLTAYVDEEEEKRILAVLPHCTPQRWCPLSLDISPADGGKEVGIAQMLRHYGIAREEAMALGDGQNDLGMLRYVGIGVAMGNAAESVQQAAGYVTGTVDEDGVYQALAHFGMI